MERMNIDATREEFERLDYFKPTDNFNGVVIIPTNKMHDSGFRRMKFALTAGENVVGCVGGCSDVIHLNGIGGYGKLEELERTLRTNTVKRINWKVNCLSNGLLRISCSHDLEIDDFIRSDFNLYVK